MRKQITQAELRSILDDERELSQRMLQIRKRLQKGDTVQRGELGAKLYGGSGDTSAEYSAEYSGYSCMGLTVDSAERIEQYEVAHA